MIEQHDHNRINSPGVNAGNLIGPVVITADTNTGVSALRTLHPSVIERGFYTLSANSKFITFPQAYSETTTLQVLLTSDTANQQFLQGIVVSGFTVSGSGSDTGHWISIGYK